METLGTGPLPDALARVRREIVGCHRCPRLVSWREETADPDGWGAPVPGFGDPAAWIFLLGLATAAGGGDRVGRAFTGNRSASFLVAALHRAGLANQATSEHVDDGLVLQRAWMASAVRCPPPGNRPTAAERSACAGHLEAEWAALPGLRVVVALGGLAWGAALRCAGVRPLPAFAHGRELPLPTGTVLLGCYHPSPQNTNTGVVTGSMLDAVLLRARTLAGME
ncbi:uracil-DNA glycosylase [Pseudonocardia sp. GCM10023141]|uniref:uracil-DNA glycosylase n=1 Tax=Pseudonocardia sp. GCM10023141 TaxID=3252653 RepID=UPI00361629C9